jgi:hypothetical protein
MWWCIESQKQVVQPKDLFVFFNTTFVHLITTGTPKLRWAMTEMRWAEMRIGEMRWAKYDGQNAMGDFRNGQIAMGDARR